MIYSPSDIPANSNHEPLSFLRRRSLWLDQVHADPELSYFTFALAYALARFFNERQGYAWPSMGRLATECRATKNGVKNAINKLVARGHLHREIRPGRNSTNHFRWVLQDRISAGMTPQVVADQTELEASKGQAPLPNSDQNTETTVALLREKRATAVSQKGNGDVEKGQQPLQERATAVAPNIIRNLIKKEVRTLSTRPRAISSSNSFEQFWAIYPRRVSRLEAEKAFAKALERTSLETVLVGAWRYSAERCDKDPQFTKSPSRWLEGDCWRDAAISQSERTQNYSTSSTVHESGPTKLDTALDRALDQLSKRFRRPVE